MSHDLAKRASSFPAVLTDQELRNLGPGDRWTLEERLGEAQGVLREFNDDELRRWVEVEGKTQTEIAELVGRDQSQVSRRCQALGIRPSSNRGRPRIMQTHNSGAEQEATDEPEEVTGEVVSDEPEQVGRMEVHYSSETDDWATPQDLFDQLDAEFNFDTDVCASEFNAKCPSFYSAEDDGLSQEWTGTCWMNPPYGEVIGQWVRKARESAEAGATVVCLVPARVDTGWWWDNCLAGEIRFLRGRLRFGGAAGAPFPSAVVVFGPNVEPRVKWWNRTEVASV